MIFLKNLFKFNFLLLLFFYFFIIFILADQLPPLFKHFIYTQFYNLTQLHHQEELLQNCCRIVAELVTAYF